VQADVADEAQVLRMFETLDAKLAGSPAWSTTPAWST
jgi:hypothetical protein